MTILQHSFESAMLSSCEYNIETKELTVTFNGGKSYVYVDVDRSTYIGLIEAPSAGKYFNSIKASLTQKLAVKA